MCGIAGFVSSGITELEPIARTMCDRIRSRGPDDHGYWCDLSLGISFGHRRLSIIDLSPLGRQPMISRSGRYIIIFNGEIYNYAELRQELLGKGHTFKGASDTEVMLAAFEQWGVEAALKRMVGMYAFALWDKNDRTLFLARDRFGEKPLYYGWNGGAFLFGSDLNAFYGHPNFKPEVDRNSITLLLKHCYIEAPHSIYRGVYKLPQGSYLALPYSALLEMPSKFSPHVDSTDSIAPRSYWRLKDAIEHGRQNAFSGTLSDASSELERLLKQAVKLQMISDVPLGAFLSGGIDSSTVVALMQAQSSLPVKTFSIGFHEQEFDEAQYAKQVAQHLGTEHTELYVSAKEMLEVVPLLPSLYSEPFADSSQVPTYVVSKLARSQVTVSLSGDGGDELFGGYSRYPNTDRLWNYLDYVPNALRPAVGGLLKLPSQRNYDLLSSIFPRSLVPSNLGFKVHKVSTLLSQESLGSFYRELVSHWEDLESVVIGSRVPRTILDSKDLWPSGLNSVELMMYLDAASYLPDDLLVKVDRAAMGVSLESRVPFLDHRVVEFVYTLPTEMRLKPNRSKVVLRDLLSRYIPSNLIDRPKMGFSVPLGEWLRGPLRSWAEELLTEKRLREDGYLDAALVREKWQQHLTGNYNWQYLIWDVLMFQGWISANRGS